MLWALTKGDFNLTRKQRYYRRYREWEYQLRSRGWDVQEFRRLLGWSREACISLFENKRKLPHRKRLQLILLFGQTLSCLQQRRWLKDAARRRWKKGLKDKTAWGRTFTTCTVAPLASREKIHWLKAIVKRRKARARLPTMRQASCKMAKVSRLKRMTKYGVTVNGELRGLPWSLKTLRWSELYVLPEVVTPDFVRKLT